MLYAVLNTMIDDYLSYRVCSTFGQAFQLQCVPFYLYFIEAHASIIKYHFA